MLTVKSFCFGPFSENTYLLINEQKQCIAIDPGAYTHEEKKYFREYISTHHLKLDAIFLTHTHIDHIFGLAALKSELDVPILGHPKCEQGFKGLEMAARLYGLQLDPPPPISKYVDEGENLHLGEEEFSLLFCPGHSPDHLVFYSAKSGIAMVGDVLFNGSIGRTDLPGGNYEQLMESIHQKLLLLPSETIIYPGHGPESTLKQEIINNPFLK